MLIQQNVAVNGFVPIYGPNSGFSTFVDTHALYALPIRQRLTIQPDINNGTNQPSTIAIWLWVWESLVAGPLEAIPTNILEPAQTVNESWQ